MLKITIVFLFITLTNFAKAEIVNLLAIPLDDKSSFTYSVDIKKECSFEGVTEIIIPSFEQAKKTNIILAKINSFQKKLNLAIDEQEITPERITFSLTGSTNIFFEFVYKRSTSTPSCNLVKVLHLNDKKYNMDHLDIIYNNFLLTPVIEKIIIRDEENQDQDSDVFLYPWQLRGQVSTYELNIGPAVSVHSNIRLKNIYSFEKADPVIKPIPGFFFRYGPFFFNKSGVGSLLFHYHDLSILGMGILEGEPYKTPGLQEREEGIFAGAIIKYNFVELTYYKDFLKNKGYNLKMNLAPEFYYGLAWKFSPQAFVQYWDNKYVEYYFGVKPEENISGLPTYKGSHTINYGGMFEVMHFVKKWTFVGNAGIKFYGNEIYSSPTVTRKNELRFAASVLYKVF